MFVTTDEGPPHFTRRNELQLKHINNKKAFKELPNYNYYKNSNNRVIHFLDYGYLLI
jgi:hypothetical protein